MWQHLAAYVGAHSVLSDEDPSSTALAPAAAYWQEGVPPESVDSACTCVRLWVYCC